MTRTRWIAPEEFEDAIATTNLLPGPGSTQLAIYSAWRVRGVAGALVGGAGFILPGLALIIGLSAAFLAHAPPDWIRGAGAGAGSAVAAVALQAGANLLLPGWRRATGARRAGFAAYVLAGAAAAALAGPWTVVVLLGCGLVELGLRHRAGGILGLPVAPLVLATSVGTGGLGALAWVAFKVGALSYGGGFVIVPLMQADAVSHYHWMTNGQFLNAVALGQVTPGPVVHTVAVVGYAASGVGGALLAAAIAFAPSFSFILLGARSLRPDPPERLGARLPRRRRPGRDRRDRGVVDPARARADRAVAVRACSPPPRSRCSRCAAASCRRCWARARSASCWRSRGWRCRGEEVDALPPQRRPGLLTAHVHRAVPRLPTQGERIARMRAGVSPTL